jgi:exopolyphosphatase/guanosine-5'-triphosphate,3'-diphosphate pyrophosphatase
MSPSRENNSDIGIKAAKKFGEVHDPDPPHAVHVCKNSLALFDALRDLHGLGDRERRLLHAAALVHDTGYATRPMAHHKGSRDLILESNLDGFSPEELRIIACIARYHRGAEPDTSHKVYADLGAESQTAVGKLAAILRVADGLDRTHVASVQRLRVERKGGKLRIYVKQRRPNLTDIACGIRKSALFERVYGVAPEIIVE